MASLTSLAVIVPPKRSILLKAPGYGPSARPLQLQHHSSTLVRLPVLASSNSTSLVRVQASVSTAPPAELAEAPRIKEPRRDPLGTNGAVFRAPEFGQQGRASQGKQCETQILKTTALEIPAADPWPVSRPSPEPWNVPAPPPSPAATVRQVADAVAPWVSRVQEDQRRLHEKWGQHSLPVMAYQGVRMAFFVGTFISQAVILAPMLVQQHEQQVLAKQEKQAPGKGSTANLPPLLSTLRSASWMYSLSSTLSTQLIPGALELMRRDSAYVAQGVYRAPYDMSPRHRQWQLSYAADAVRSSVGFFSDVTHRRQRSGWQETTVSSEEARVNQDKYPEYYLQNFHFQDGWLSEFSADGYEASTETLFMGMQDSMQRTGLVPLHHFMLGREQAGTVLADVACGTGRFLTFIKDNYPEMTTIGVDLSPQFLRKAEENMAYFKKFDKQENGGRAIGPSKYVQAKAEGLPFKDASVDVVSCVYLFHEIPPETRRQVVQEMFRALKPGGIVILNDSVQTVDGPPIDLSFFSSAYHEPYYVSYQKENFPALFEAHGFHSVWASVAHLSKVWCFQKL